MDATCKFCGKPAEFEVAPGDGTTCGRCAKRAERRRLIFDVGEGPSSGREAEAPQDPARSMEPSPPEEMRMFDLLNLAKRTRDSLTTLDGAETLEVPLSVREAILLVDSIAPAAIAPASFGVDSHPLGPPSSTPSPSPTSSTPTRRRLRAVYSGVGLLAVMAALVVVKASVGREVASAAGLAPDPSESAAVLLATPQTQATSAPPVVAAPTTAPKAPAAPATMPRRAPTQPTPTRPRAPADTPQIRVAADAPTPPVDLLGAMAAAVAARSAPSGAPRVGSPASPPGGSGALSPSDRGEPRTSPLHP